MVAECVYCEFEVEYMEKAPELRDEKAWKEASYDHALGCEWIATRAHRLPSDKSDARLTHAGLDKLIDEALLTNNPALARACVDARANLAYYKSIVALALHDADALRGT
jgi:hypothetical protein